MPRLTLILMLGLGARFVVPKLAEMNPLTLGLIKDGVDWKHACLASALAVGVTAGESRFYVRVGGFQEGDKQFEQTSFDEFRVSRRFVLRGVPRFGGGNALSRGFNARVGRRGSRGVLVAPVVFGRFAISTARKKSLLCGVGGYGWDFIRGDV